MFFAKIKPKGKKEIEVCHVEDETPEHIISGCVLGKLFWEKLNISQMLGTETKNLHTIRLTERIPNDEFAAFVALSCWQLWKARNAAIFRNENWMITFSQPAKMQLNNGDAGFLQGKGKS